MLDILKDSFVARTPNLPRDNGSNEANIWNKLFQPSMQIISIQNSDWLMET